MPRRPIGNAAMSNAERSRRRRIKAKAVHDAAPSPDVPAVQANGSEQSVAEVFAGRDYPRMLYHPDGRTTIVATPEAHEALTADRWGMVPLAVHRRRPVTSHGALGSDPMAVMIGQAIREVLDEYDLSRGCQ